MAISITKYTVSNDMSQLELDFALEAGSTVTSLKLWTNDNYKDPSQAVDITSLANATTANESLIITASNAGVSSFTGIYFIEIESSNSDAAIVATINLTQYYVVLAKLIANIDLSCLNCNANFQNALLFDMYLQAVDQSLTWGRFQDAIDNLSKLIISIETSECSECNEIEPVVSTAGNVVSVGVIDSQLQNFS